MRNRKEILSYYRNGYSIDNDILEVLLDIRDLLANPPIEIVEKVTGNFGNSGNFGPIDRPEIPETK